MASRNRTLLFKKYRDALRSVRVPTSSSHASASPSTSSAAGGPVIELVSSSLLHPNRSYAPLSTEDPGNSSKGALTVGLPPAWVDVSEEIAANVQRARVKMMELAKAHAKALMPSFGDGKEDQRLIESLTQDITNLIKKSEKGLKRLFVAGPSEDSNIRKNVQRSLATDLQNLSMELRKKQSTYLKRLRQQKEEGQDGIDIEMNLNGNRSRMEDDDLEHMVVESVNELAQIMKDLSVLVIDQGTIIDRIDYNIQNVATTVEEGLKQLQKAERTQKQGGMVMCASVLIIMCFVMLLMAFPGQSEVLEHIGLTRSSDQRFPVREGEGIYLLEL
ncbi:syntaxin-43 [Cucumis melo var. makuwa]|uniref:Syntaxin-43 n=1 Tax=Cucumis melo var. makuwa TaxID=1194695 RepID=A0A5A7U3M4_CUCMM|nr:syntaxin-43 [Cucumis melo var. makuwa]TYJ96487.1 syntaxin-43 [Cucumis melo var. makuwa]